MNLYELAHQYRADVAKLEDLELDEKTLSDTLESLSGDLELKAVNVIKFAKNLDATASAIKEAEAAMAERRKSLEKRSDAIRAYVFHSMLSAGISKIESPYFALSIANNPASVDVFDSFQVPSDYMREIPATSAPDKALIKRALQDGYDVPGARLVQGQRLSIK